ncbi:MAG: serine acetyltransferase [Chloroflexi bacterium]|nr:serine acetyltransferase [Chloroflexota bacterium]
MKPRPFEQLSHLGYEVGFIINHHWWRWFTIWFTSAFWVVCSYRVDRFCYLIFGNKWKIIRLAISPLLFLTRPWRGNCEIHYEAEIGPGLVVLHPTLGVVVSKYTIAGHNLILTGGNCIGASKRLNLGDIKIGDNVDLGANAIIIGPVQIGNNVRIGAGAVVVNNAESDGVLVGVPAKLVNRPPSE